MYPVWDCERDKELMKRVAREMANPSAVMCAKLPCETPNRAAGRELQLFLFGTAPTPSPRTSKWATSTPRDCPNSNSFPITFTTRTFGHCGQNWYQFPTVAIGIEESKRRPPSRSDYKIKTPINSSEKTWR